MGAFLITPNKSNNRQTENSVREFVPDTKDDNESEGKAEAETEAETIKEKIKRKIDFDPKNYEFNLLHYFAMAEDIGTRNHDIDMSDLLFDYFARREPLEFRYRNLCIMMGLERKPYKSLNMTQHHESGILTQIPENMIIIKEYIDKKQTICELQAEIDKLIANNDADQRTVAE